MLGRLGLGEVVEPARDPLHLAASDEALELVVAHPDRIELARPEERPDPGASELLLIQAGPQ